MKEYIEVNLSIKPANNDTRELLIAKLYAKNFDSFMETEQGIKAYIEQGNFNITILESVFHELETIEITDFSYQNIKEQDWNKVWEENYYEPTLIGNQCIIRGSFHTDFPKAKYEIQIDPKMSFGTGHHSSTQLMVEQILKTDVNDKSILDLGCGTGILAILCEMKGATNILAIDNNDWAIENTVENTEKNNIKHVIIKKGDATDLKGKIFDIILANINRNTILNDISLYVKAMHQQSIIYLSGFFTEHLDAITESAEKAGLGFVDSSTKNNWAAAWYILKA